MAELSLTHVQLEGLNMQELNTLLYVIFLIAPWG